jgi:LysM repeat protein
MAALARDGFGPDRTVVTSLGLSLAQGVMQGGVIPIAKHFPGYGAAVYRPDGLGLVVHKDMGGLAETMFPFNEAVNQDIPGMIVGHVAVPVLDKDVELRPASMSPLLVDKILRERWGFDGVIVSDDLSKPNLLGGLAPDAAAVRALAAGCDAVLYLDSDPSSIRAVCDAIDAAAADGQLDPARLAASKKRLDGWQTWLDSRQTSRPAPPIHTPIAAPPPGLVEMHAAPIVQTPSSAETLDTAPAAQAQTPETQAAVSPTEMVAEDPVNALNNAPEPTVALNPPPSSGLADRPPAPDLVQSPPAEASAVTPETTPAPVQSDPVDAGANPVAETSETPSAPAEPPPALTEPAPTPEPQDTGTSTDELVPPADAPDQTPLTTEEPAAEPNASVTSETPEPAPSTPEASAPEMEPDAPAEAETNPDEDVPAAMPEQVHLVEPGETLSGIASAYGVTMDQIVEWNNLDDTNINSGAKLRILSDAKPTESALKPSSQPEPDPGPVTTHVVEEGDTLLKISRKYNTTTEKLIALNKLRDANHVFIGQRLTVPAE